MRIEWFTEMLQLAFVTTIVGDYHNFGEIGQYALEIVEKKHRKQLSPEVRSQLPKQMRELPAHRDVKEGLRRLRDSNFRLMALTNSTQETAEAQLESAGLRDFFERIFSADSVRRLKPAPEPYQFVARELGTNTESFLMVAAHSWDIAGAMHAGCRAAFLARPGKELAPLARPSLVARDLPHLADQILTSGRGGNLTSSARASA